MQNISGGLLESFTAIYCFSGNTPQVAQAATSAYHNQIGMPWIVRVAAQGVWSAGDYFFQNTYMQQRLPKQIVGPVEYAELTECSYFKIKVVYKTIKSLKYFSCSPEENVSFQTGTPQYECVSI